MIDLKYYANLYLNGENKELFLKRFGHFKFKNLYNASSFPDKLDEYMQSKEFSADEQEQLKNIWNSFSLSIKSSMEEPFTFLANNVFPYIDMESLLSDYNAKHKQSGLVLDCPCCNEKESAFVVIDGGIQTGTISCHRLKNCGKTSSVFNIVRQRDGLGYIDTIRKLSDYVGLDYDIHVRNQEMHLEDNCQFRTDEIRKEGVEIEIQKGNSFSSRDEYGLSDIEFKSIDTSKSFKENVNIMKYLHRYNEFDVASQIQLIYSYIKSFTMRENDRNDMEQYFSQRGITKEQLHNVGFLKAKKINQLVNELKEVFGTDDLVKYGILNDFNKSWKYMLKTKDDEYIYNDSAVFFMHDIYTDIPTNIEFKFFGDKVNGSKRKAISMANSNIIDSNYYGNANNIDFLKDAKKNLFWVTEGSVDCKTLEHFNQISFGLIGAGKHFNPNLGYYKDKIAVIALDEDKAGIDNTLKLALKFKKAGMKHIFIASWDEKYGNDLNDLLKSRNMDKIKIVYADFVLNSNNEYVMAYSLTNTETINLNLIEKGYEKAFPTVSPIKEAKVEKVEKELPKNLQTISEYFESKKKQSKAKSTDDTLKDNAVLSNHTMQYTRN